MYIEERLKQLVEEHTDTCVWIEKRFNQLEKKLDKVIKLLIPDKHNDITQDDGEVDKTTAKCDEMRMEYKDTIRLLLKAMK